MALKSWPPKIIHLLERFTHIDMRYLLRGSFWSFLEQSASTLAGFALAFAFARLMPKETYGTYQYVLSLAGLLAIPTLSDMNTALVRAVAKGYAGTLRLALKTKLQWGTLSTLAGLLLAAFYFGQGKANLGLALVIVSFLVPFFNAFMVYGAYWRGEKRFDKITKYNITSQLVSVAGLGATLLATQNLYLILLAYFGFHTLTRFLFLSATLQKIKGEQRCDHKTISYGKHLSLMGIFYQISNNAAGIILFAFLGAAPLAIYSFAILIPHNLKTIFTNTFPIALPKFSEQPKAQIKATLLAKIAKLYLILIPLIIVYILAAPWLYRVFFTQYTDAIFYSRLSAVTILFIPQTLIALSLQAHQQKKMLYILSIFSPIITLSTLFIFVPLYGLAGAIIASIVAQSIGFGLNIFLFKKM